MRLVGGFLFCCRQPNKPDAIQTGANLIYVHETIHLLAVRIHSRNSHAGTRRQSVAADPFLSAALAIIPIAALIVLSTEQLATRTGDAVGVYAMIAILFYFLPVAKH